MPHLVAEGNSKQVFRHSDQFVLKVHKKGKQNAGRSLCITSLLHVVSNSYPHFIPNDIVPSFHRLCEQSYLERNLVPNLPDTWTFEIKPKQALPFQIDKNRHLESSRFVYKQFQKLEESRILRKSDYDPLFILHPEATKASTRNALKFLTLNPQNNLRIWKSDSQLSQETIRSFSSKESEIFAKLSEILLQQKNTLSFLVLFTAFCEHQQEIAQEIYTSIPQIADSDFIYTEILRAVKQRIGVRPNILEWDNILKLQILHREEGRKLLLDCEGNFDTRRIEKLNWLRRFLIGRTACDCSLIISISKSKNDSTFSITDFDLKNLSFGKWADDFKKLQTFSSKIET